MSARQRDGAAGGLTDLANLVGLLFPLGFVLVFLERAQEQEDLGDDDLCERLARRG